MYTQFPVVESFTSVLTAALLALVEMMGVSSDMLAGRIITNVWFTAITESAVVVCHESVWWCGSRCSSLLQELNANAITANDRAAALNLFFMLVNNVFKF